MKAGSAREDDRFGWPGEGVGVLAAGSRQTLRGSMSATAHVRRWLPLDQLADIDVRPGALKHALVAAGADRTPFWPGGNGCADGSTSG